MRMFRFANHLESGIYVHMFKGFRVVRKEYNSGDYVVCLILPCLTDDTGCATCNGNDNVKKCR